VDIYPNGEPRGACEHPSHWEYVKAQDTIAALHRRRVRHGREHREAVLNLEMTRLMVTTHLRDGTH
jgi:hypothetical protein